MKCVMLKYVVNGSNVVIRVNQTGEIVGMFSAGVDKTDDGNFQYEVIEALQERGVNLQEAISMAFEKAQRENESARAGA